MTWCVCTCCCAYIPRFCSCCLFQDFCVVGFERSVPCSLAEVTLRVLLLPCMHDSQRKCLSWFCVSFRFGRFAPGFIGLIWLVSVFHLLPFFALLASAKTPPAFFLFSFWFSFPYTFRFVSFRFREAFSAGRLNVT